jgi:NTE family protein
MLERGSPLPAQPGLLDLMSRSLDTMQAQLSRLQLAVDPPDLLIRVPRDTCMFHEYWRAAEVIDAGRAAARRALAGIIAG